MRLNCLWVALAVCWAFPVGARAQCDGQWLPGQGLPGVDNPPYASVEWDPDGGGPAPSVLVVGGGFIVSGGQRSNYVAMWDGSDWSTLGTGMNNFVYGLAVFNEQLFACGAFTRAGGNPAVSIARWDGSSWNPVGNPAGTSLSGGFARSLAVHNGKLIVGGSMTSADGVPCGGLVAWDGSAWSTFGIGINSGALVYSVATLAGDLFAAGSFTSLNGAPINRIGRWVGNAWTEVGSGASDTVRALASYQNDLYATGDFTSAGGIAGTSRIARWNGTAWQPLTTGLTGLFSISGRSLTVFDGTLVVGGQFDTAGGVSSPGLARWNGSSWTALGPSDDQFPQVTHVGTFGSELLVGTLFGGYGKVVGKRIFRWNGSSWNRFEGSNIGFDAGTPVLLASQGVAYAVGGFKSIAGIPISRVARWDGTAWSALGSGLPGVGLALAEYNNQLVAAGSWYGGIAAWNGQTWTTPPNGPTNLVYALTVFNGKLIAAGDFTTVGSTAANRIASWDGLTWMPLGAGLSGTSASVRTLAVYGNELIAAGHFTSAGGVGANNIARWNGASWQPLASGLTGGSGTPEIEALHVHQGALFAGGRFSTSGINAIGSVARWDGAQWSSLGATFAGGTAIDSLTTYNGDLVIGGSISQINSVSMRCAARWNGTSWSPLGSGMNFQLTSFAQLHGELLAGGAFSTAGGNVSAYFARWTDTNIPWIASQPKPALLSLGQPASLSVTAATGYDNLAYQWRHILSDGSRVNLSDDGHFTGTTTATLSITSAAPDDVGGYECIVSNACGSETCAVATLLCSADIDGNTFVNGEDFDTFVAAFELGDPTADFDHNTFVNGDDFDRFALAFEAGC